MKIIDKLLINGEWVDGEAGTTIDVLNPYDNSLITKVAEAKEADVDKAVAAAKAALEVWKSYSASERGHFLLKLADKIEENAEELAQIETMDTGHPIRDTRNLDVQRTAYCFRYFGGMADKLEGSVIPVDSGFPKLYGPSANWCCGTNRSLELPSNVYQLENGSCPGLW